LRGFPADYTVGDLADEHATIPSQPEIKGAVCRRGFTSALIVIDRPTLAAPAIKGRTTNLNAASPRLRELASFSSSDQTEAASSRAAAAEVGRDCDVASTTEALAAAAAS
jgi:hypothetical protein